VFCLLDHLHLSKPLRQRGNPQGIALAAARLAAGSTALGNLIVDAWLDSANTPVGYPMVNVRDIENGKVPVTRALFGRTNPLAARCDSCWPR